MVLQVDITHHTSHPTTKHHMGPSAHLATKAPLGSTRTQSTQSPTAPGARARSSRASWRPLGPAAAAAGRSGGACAHVVLCCAVLCWGCGLTRSRLQGRRQDKLAAAPQAAPAAASAASAAPAGGGSRHRASRPPLCDESSHSPEACRSCWGGRFEHGCPVSERHSSSQEAVGAKRHGTRFGRMTTANKKDDNSESPAQRGLLEG
jgi:hypothetical protein